jgi:hypothetical protein
VLPENKPKVLYGPDGRIISSKNREFSNTKSDPPKTGNAFGAWAGRDVSFVTLPGGGVVQFDLSKLTVEDFRAMRDHYQVNASLSVLSFMQHQSDFHVVCEDKRVQDFCDAQLHENWTMLNRAMSQSNWAGYSPNALEWDNDLQNRKLILSKVKDLIPEECRVNWKEERGWAPPNQVKPKFFTYNGIKQNAISWPILVENSFWYPLLMENGDYYGKKLLKPAFQSWFFSILVHLFANRYYERFGEPTPIGRAPFDEEPSPDGTEGKTAQQWMLEVLTQLRNRAVVTLPNSMQQLSDNKYDYEYGIEYLESQMRGADFERYLTRLDEEISIGLFTPILLLRTADVGSYNLGVGHMQMYLWMLNAMNDDRAHYLDRYILSPMTDYNFTENAPRPHVVFHKLGNQNMDLIRDVIVAMVKNKQLKPNIDELGQAMGMTLKEIRQTTTPPPAPAPAGGSPDPNNTDPNSNSNPANKHEIIQVALRSPSTLNTVEEIKKRVHSQVRNAFSAGKFDNRIKINLGYKNRMKSAMDADGLSNSHEKTERLYNFMDHWMTNVMQISEDFDNPEDFIAMFDNVLISRIASL